MARRRYSTRTRWEPLVGYSRAVRVGAHIYVSGTTSTNAAGEIVAPSDRYGQTLQIIANIRAALRALGAGLDDVVRTRIYVTDMDFWQEVGRAHGEFFGHTRPATSMVEVSRLILPEVLVEIEAEAVVDEASGDSPAADRSPADSSPPSDEATEP